MTTTIAKITITAEQSAQGVIGYLADIRSVGDYYSPEDQAPMRWIATDRLRQAFAIRGDMVGRGPELGLLLEGRHPVTGEVIRRWGPNGSMVAAHDVTISPAPKSVSILWGLGDRPLQRIIEAAVWNSAARAIQVLLDEALVRERYGPGSADIRNVTMPDIIGVDVLHTVARLSNAAEMPDPQLHVHSLLVGALDQAGQLRALDSLAIHRAQAFVDAFASSCLAAELQAHGFELSREVDDRGRVRWEVVGVPASLVEAMSSRSADVTALEREYEEFTGNPATGRGWQRFKAASRRSKRHHDPSSLREAWEETGREHGFGPEEAAALAARAAEHAQPLPRPDTATEAAAQFRREFLAEVCREYALVPDSHVWRTAMRLSVGLLDPPAVARAVAQLYRDGELLATEKGLGGLVTTPAVLETERRAIDAATRLLDADAEEPVTAEELERILRRAKEDGRPFDVGQEEALRAATSGSRFVSVTGPAGTGKGVATRGMVDAFRSQGRRTIAVAVAGRTSQQAREDSGADEGMTIDALTARMSSPGPFTIRAGDVLIVDEGGMVDHERYAALLTVASLNGATVIQVGDDKQLAPVAAGGLWTVSHRLAEQRGRTAELAQQRRARDPREAQAWTDVRAGKVLEGLAYWREQGRLRLYESRRDMHEGMIEAWWQDREGRGIMLVDTSNLERDLINARAQQRRLDAGQLGAEELETEAGRSVRAGDEVLFSAILPVEQVREVQQPDEEARVPRRVENGTTATVLAIDPEARTATLRLHEPAQDRDVQVGAEAPLELGYARHVAKGQGMTAEGVANLAVGDHTDSNRFYTMVTRGRDGAQIHAYIDDVATMALPTMPAASDQQRRQLRELGMAEIPEAWTRVDASLEIDARTGRTLGSTALDELARTGAGEQVAGRIVVQALSARQERQGEPLAPEDLAPGLTVAAQPVSGPPPDRTAEQERGAAMLRELNRLIEQRQAQEVRIRAIAKDAERDGSKEAVGGRPVYQSEQRAAAADHDGRGWGDQRPARAGLETFDNVTSSTIRQRRAERDAAFQRAAQDIQALRQRGIQRTPRPRVTRPRAPEPLRASTPIESLGRAHLAGDVARAEAYYRVAGQMHYHANPEAEAARLWFGARDAVLVVRDQDQGDAVRREVARHDPQAEPHIITAAQAYKARAAEQQRPGAAEEGPASPRRAYILAEREDRDHLTRALSAADISHWIATPPEAAASEQVADHQADIAEAIERHEDATRARRTEHNRERALELAREPEREATRAATRAAQRDSAGREIA